MPMHCTITDALLGAAGPTSVPLPRHALPEFQGADSPAAHRLRTCVQAAGWQLLNLDTTIGPGAKMAPHIDAMRARLAEVLGVSPAQINVKAKTAEKMGPVGEGGPSRRVPCACWREARMPGALSRCGPRR